MSATTAATIQFESPDAQFVTFRNPRLVCVVNSAPDSKARAVLDILATQLPEGMTKVFASFEELSAQFRAGLSPKETVLLFDEPFLRGGKNFTMTTSLRKPNLLPKRGADVQWGVAISSSCHNVARCANQVHSNFFAKFDERLTKQHYPWGPPRKKEAAPVTVEEFPEAEISSLIHRLNQGPNLHDPLVNAKPEDALELPSGTHISWLRVPLNPMRYVGDMTLRSVMKAMEQFQVVSSGLVATSEPTVLRMLSAGVHIPAQEPDLLKVYLSPPTNKFSVRRPDLHNTGKEIFASEEDEQPGGCFAQAHIDACYGINAERWKRCFDWLTHRGLLLFAVSSEWSKPYLSEFVWAHQYLTSLGYNVALATSDSLESVSVTSSGVFYRGEAVGMIWRQFPIFEASGKFAEFVRASSGGLVQMVPEFGFWGNKALFSVFRKFNDYFRQNLSPDDFGILDSVLPDSHLVLPDDIVGSFPFSVASFDVLSLEHLRSLPSSARDQLVLKVCGANTLAARSYGVLMGHGLAEAVWNEWLDERIRLHQPFIVQRCLPTGKVQVAAYNISRRCTETFLARILMRPWEVNGELVSVSGSAVPADTRKVHGRSDMAAVTFSLD